MLTGREKDVMRLVARGYTNQEVCKKLCIEYSTMRSHLDSAYKKLSKLRNGKKIKMTRVRAVLIYLGLAKAEDYIMDKVIIDGIDVSECEHFGIDSMELCKINFDNNYFSNGIPCAEKCSNHSNCYYKQLQKLKHQYADVLKLAKENADSNEFCLQELEQENERLKEEITKLSDPRYQISKVNEGYYNRMNTYKQALQEIREICLSALSYDFEKEEILDKINEVIGAE